MLLAANMRKASATRQMRDLCNSLGRSGRLQHGPAAWTRGYRAWCLCCRDRLSQTCPACAGDDWLRAFEFGAWGCVPGSALFRGVFAGTVGVRPGR